MSPCVDCVNKAHCKIRGGSPTLPCVHRATCQRAGTQGQRHPHRDRNNDESRSGSPFAESIRELMRAHLALCSHGFLGLITSDAPIATPYSANYQDLSWAGIHMTDNRGKKIGDRWQSKKPRILCHIGHIAASCIIGRFQCEPHRWLKFPRDHTGINYVGGNSDWVEMTNGDRWRWEGDHWSQTAGTGGNSIEAIDEAFTRR